MKEGKKEKTHQAASRVDAGVTSPDAVEPLGLGELPKAVLLHDVGSRELELPGVVAEKKSKV